jgi:uncharacterized protein (TIGR02246 family)
MKKTLLLAVALPSLLIGYLWGSHSNNTIRQGVIVNSGLGLEEIQAVTEEYVDAWNRKDFDASTMTYAKDALFMSPGVPVMHGRDAIKQFEVHSREADSREMDLSEQVREVIYFEDWAVMWGTGSLRTHNSDSTTEESTYKWVMLSRRNAEGRWESVWDIFNDDA